MSLNSEIRNLDKHVKSYMEMFEVTRFILKLGGKGQGDLVRGERGESELSVN